MTTSSPHSPNLISPAYLEEQRRLHADPRGYGTKGRKWADQVADVARQFGACASILDYGAGQGSLGAELRARGFVVADYDPAVESMAAPPAPADLVVCTDVLEHVEPDKVDAVVDHLGELARVAAFVVISLVPTAKTLSDGRQAHISLHPSGWWAARLSRRFRVVEVLKVKPEKQWVVVLQKRES